MKTAITYSDVYIPQNSYSIDEYVKQVDVSSLSGEVTQDDVANILKYTMGVENVYIEERKDAAKIFSTLLDQYFSTGATTPDEIDCIIYTRGNSVAVGDPWTLNAEEECINIPYFLQDEFKMKNAQIFNVEQECSGTLVALRIALSMIDNNSIRKMLILSGNFFESPEKRLMGGMIVVSDGLGIMEVSTSETGLALLDFASKTDGGIPRVLDLASISMSQKVVQIGSDLIKDLVKRNHITMSDISLIIPQNLSKNIWAFYCQMLDFPKENVFLENISDGGHMGDVDMIRNITAICRKKLLASKEYAIAYGLGTGTAWNSLLLQAL